MEDVQMLKYPSLTNHNKIGSFTEEMLESIKGMDFYATEKLDGSNVSLSIDMQTLSCIWASRNREVMSDDEQFGVLYTMFDLNNASHYLQQIKSLGYHTGTIHIYGELFGGKIQRQDYDANKEGRLDIRFFDIIIETPTEKIALGYDELEFVVGRNIIVPIIMIDSLENLISKEPTTESGFGGQNEGYVYKPFNTHSFEDGHYPVIKHKTDEYMESCNIKRNKEHSNPYKATEMDERLLAYVTPQRLMNVISHGDIEPKAQNIGALIQEMIRDIVKEFASENDMTTEMVEGYLNGHISRQVATVVRTEVLKGGF